MTNPHVTIRHLRHAIHLIMSGAVRDIEAEFGPDELDAAKDLVAHAFEKAAEELNDWELPTEARRQEDLALAMQAMLGDDDCPMIVRKLLVKHDLLP